MKRALYSSVMAICMTVISACSMMRPDMYDIRECEPGQIVDFAEYARACFKTQDLCGKRRCSKLRT